MTWLKRLELAKQFKRFTANDKRKSSYFDSCAIGEKFNLINLRHDEICFRMSKDVRILGERFYQAVVNGDVEKARNIYDDIQGLEQWEQRLYS